MAAIFLSAPVFQALDDDGTPLPGALLYFYATTTTSNQDVYLAADLADEHEQPVEADAFGRFPEIFLDRSLSYRAILKDSGGTTVADMDPINPAGLGLILSDIPDGLITDEKLHATAITDKLGYTPLNKAGDTATDLDLAHATPNASSAGYMGAPPNTQNAAYALLITDAGKTILHTDGTARAYTIPLAASVNFADETYIVIRNIGTGIVTITRTGGVALLGEGSGTDKNWALAQHGKAVISKYTGDTWYISGSGLS